MVRGPLDVRGSRLLSGRSGGLYSTSIMRDDDRVTVPPDSHTLVTALSTGDQKSH